MSAIARTRLLVATALLVCMTGTATLHAAEVRQTPAGHPRLASRYLPMRDGVKIAIDVWLPESLQAEQRIPTLMRATRYWRARGMQDKAIKKDTNYREAQFANAAGYALVLVDARGTGASFGNARLRNDRR